MYFLHLQEKIMSIITSKIIGETETSLVMQFISPSGKEIIKTVTKAAGISNERLAQIWHSRITHRYMDSALKANRFKRTITEETSDSITIKFDKRAA